MIAADKPVQRSTESKLLHVDASGRIQSVPRSSLVDLLRPGDVVIANDAATLPASLRGVHLQTGIEVEVRLASRASLAPDDVLRFNAIVLAQATIERGLKIARCRHRWHRANGFALDP